MAKFKKREKHVPLEEPKGTRVQAAGESNRKKFYALIIFVFSFLLYSNTLSHDYALDDDVIFKENRYVQQGLEGVSDIFSHGFLHGFNQRNNQSYRPLVSTVFAIEHELFGADPFIGHLLNVLFYALACLLLFLTLSKMFHSYGLIVPFLITLLYVAHPLHTEVVANVKGRDDMLTFLFMSLTLYFLFDYVRKSSMADLAISAISYFACLLTKENAVAIIAVIPLTLYVFGELDVKRSLQLTVPFAAVLLVYLVIRDQVLDSVGFGETLDIVNNTLMAAKTQSEMLATNFVILGKYLALLVYPHPLSFDYSYNQFPIVNWGNWQALLSILVYTALGVYALSNILKRDIIAYGILFYLITFSVTSNLFVKIGATLGERFMFIPSLGFVIAFVFLLIKLLKLNESAYNKSAYSIALPAVNLLVGVVLIVVIAYSAKTYTRNFDWKNNLTLFRADIDATPNSARTHFSLAATLNTTAVTQEDPAVKAQMLQESIAGFQRSVEIYPEFASAWYNMGVAYFNNGDPQNAQIAYENCLLYNTFDKQALNNLGVIYFNRNDYNTAIEYFSRAVEAHTNFPDPYANLGACYHNMGDSQNAIKFYTKALQFNPDNQMVNGNLAKLYNTLGDTEKAAYYRKRSGQ